MLRVLNRLVVNMPIAKKLAAYLPGSLMAKEDGDLLLLETGDGIILEY